MKKELKQAIVNFIFDNEKEFQIVNTTIDRFRNYIYGNDGNYLIGGKDVSYFITKQIELLID